MVWTFWNEIKKQFKFFDGVIIICLIMLSFAPYVAFGVYQKDKTFSASQTEAIILLNGKEIDRFVLSEETEHLEKTYQPKKNQYNIIEIDGTRIRMKEDNSPDQIAVNTGWIDQPGQSSVCLPHRLTIDIQGVPDDEEDDMIITR